MDDEGDEEEEEDHRHGPMLTPDMSSMLPKDTMVHRTELDDQERLDLEEEAREREISGQGFSGAQTTGQPAAVQPGKYGDLDVYSSPFPSCLSFLGSESRAPLWTRPLTSAPQLTYITRSSGSG